MADLCATPTTGPLHLPCLHPDGAGHHGGHQWTAPDGFDDDTNEDPR